MEHVCRKETRWQDLVDKVLRAVQADGASCTLSYNNIIIIIII